MRAVLLTGPSASGKTTVAKRLQVLLREPWLFFEVDRTQPWMPPFEELVTVENDRRMVAANLRAARAYVDAGFNLLIEADMAEEWRQRMVGEVFAGVEYRTVALTADLTTIEMRARERATVNVAWAFEHAHHRDWAAHADRVERTDDRTADDVASSLAAWIDGAPNAHSRSR